MTEEPRHRITRVAPPADKSVAEQLERTAAASAAVAGAEAAAARPERQGTNGSIDTVAIELPDGRSLELSPPKVSIAATAIMIAAELTEIMEASPRAQSVATVMLTAQIEACMYVRAIEGQRVRSPTNAEQYKGLANLLNDNGLKAVQAAVLQHWPQPTLDRAGQVKKNQRDSELS